RFALTIHDLANVVVIFKPDRQVLCYAHRPRIIECANQDKWSLSQLSEARIRSGQNAKGAISGYERRNGARKCHNIVNIQTATLARGDRRDRSALKVDSVGWYAKTIRNPT